MAVVVAVVLRISTNTSNHIVACGACWAAGAPGSKGVVVTIIRRAPAAVLLVKNR